MFGIIFRLFLFSVINSIKIGKIDNSIIVDITNNIFSNLTRDQCLCQMLKTNQLISALNYFQTNNTCQLFYYNTSSITIEFYSNASIIFLNQSEITITTIQSTSSSSLINLFWSFDGNLNEKNLNYNSISINNVSFVSPGITGYGSAVCFNASRSQYIIVNTTTNLNLSFNSFTFELWVYPYSLPSGDRGLIGQCQSLSNNICLHSTIRSSNTRISFYGNACLGSTVIVINKWYHLTFVYNYLTLTQFIYINGVLECNHTSSPPLQITNLTYIPLTIGYTSPYAPYYFDGLIDQLSIINLAKNSTEILNDATLVVWYSFDNNSSKDLGPNGINGTSINTTFDNNSILFNNTKSYFQSSGFVLLGFDNRTYSFSIWINPIQTNASTVIHISQNSSISTKWCLPFLQFNSQGKIQAQSRSNLGVITVTGPSISPYSWTHIAQTYSLTNGVSLYINGTLFNKSSSCDYHGGNTPLIITLGSSPDGICSNTTSQGDQYLGWINHFESIQEN